MIQTTKTDIAHTAMFISNLTERPTERISILIAEGFLSIDSVILIWRLIETGNGWNGNHGKPLRKLIPKFMGIHRPKRICESYNRICHSESIRSDLRRLSDLSEKIYHSCRESSNLSDLMRSELWEQDRLSFQVGNPIIWFPFQIIIFSYSTIYI